jgi:hypothetical protein
MDRSLGQMPRSHLEVIEKHLFGAKLQFALRISILLGTTIVRQSVACKIKVLAIKVKVTHRDQSSHRKI